MSTPQQMTQEQRDAEFRKILFVPCISKKQLHKWIIMFLDLDIPDSIVDPTSNCSPMDMIWEVYNKLRTKGGEDFNRVLYYASRDSFKTLGAAILEVLTVVHLQLNVAHMAAIEAQSIKSQEYVKAFFDKPMLKPYKTGDAKEKTEFERYAHKQTGDSLTRTQFNHLPADEQAKYTSIKNYVRIVICTMAGANSEHVPLFVIDEVDVVTNPKAYEQAKLIPAPMNGTLPVTALTSTRKFSFGMVQKEMDEEFGPDGERRLHIRHWNIVDVTAACEPARHQPELPKIPIYVDESNLRAINEEAYQELSGEERKKFNKEEGYGGCLKNCRLFSVCHGRLATLQKSKSSLLKPIAHTANQIRAAGKNIELVQAELLCRKPSKKGLIYPTLDRSIHMLTPAQMAEKVTGEPQRADMTKAGLMEVFIRRGMKAYGGQDYGWTHNFVDVTGWIDGQRLFITDVVSAPQLMPDQMIRAVDHLKKFNRAVYGDPEDPRMVNMLKQAGHRMQPWRKDPGSVVGGINIVRMRLQPPMAEPLLFFLAGDPGVELLFKRLSEYHWKIDPTGTLVDGEPDDENDDEPDAFRYLVMNRFAAKGKVKSASETKDAKAPGVPEGYTPGNWLQKWKSENGVSEVGTDSTLVVSRGGFKALI